MTPRRPCPRLFLAAALLAAAALASAAALPAPAAPALAAGGITIRDESLLRTPAGAADTPLARTPPDVYVRILDDLPPDGPKGTLWSVWGDGCLASNSRYYFAVGDHLDLKDTPGRSRLYEFDPATKALRVVLNLRDVIPEAKFAAGKVHSRIEEAADGGLYFATYWGKSPKEADLAAGFLGSVLLRFDPSAGRAESLGVPLPGLGLPTSLLDRRRNVLYFYAVYKGDLVAYDLGRRSVTFQGGGDLQAGHRSLMLDLDGSVYFSTKTGGLARFSPADGRITETRATLPPGGRRAEAAAALRASTRAARNGTIYGLTHAGILFAFDPKAETVRVLGPNYAAGDYTAVLLLSPDEKYLYYAPGSHGSDVRYGAPVVQYDLATGGRKVLAYLLAPLRERLGYTLGGTFCLTLTPDGGTLLGAFNGAPHDPASKKEETFGRPALVRIAIPADERP